MAGIASARNVVAVLIVGALMLGCSPAASPSLSAAPPVSAGPSAGASAAPPVSAAPSAGASAAGIVLQRTGPIGCDAIGIDYKSATIKIDAASDPDVWAETETGKKLTVSWTDGFTATNGDAPVINGPKGEEVARDQDRRPGGRLLSEAGRVLRVPGARCAVRPGDRSPVDPRQASPIPTCCLDPCDRPAWPLRRTAWHPEDRPDPGSPWSPRV
jgi:hypothetical protein